jgi:hypothetical protein
LPTFEPIDIAARGGPIVTNPVYVKFFEEFGIGDVSLVGGKNAAQVGMAVERPDPAVTQVSREAYGNVRP